jgi:hypothetical protein
MSDHLILLEIKTLAAANRTGAVLAKAKQYIEAENTIGEAERHPPVEWRLYFLWPFRARPRQDG